MMIDLCNKLVDNDLTREELLERVTIKKTNVNDIIDICSTLAKAFNLSCIDEAIFQMINSRVLYNESVKLVDNETNEIYGLLIFTEYNINQGSPIEHMEKGLSEYLKQFKQVNGHSFIIDERLRGCGFDRKMINFNRKFLTDNYDFLWAAVEKDLRTHQYWKRLGFIDVFRIEEASFYIMPLNKKFLSDIYCK